MALASLKTCLGIDQEPAVVDAHLMKECIAQYEVGHSAKLRRIQLEVAKVGGGNGYGEGSASSGHFSAIGASLYGVAVPDLVNKARQHADELLARAGYE